MYENRKGELIKKSKNYRRKTMNKHTHHFFPQDINYTNREGKLVELGQIMMCQKDDCTQMRIKTLKVVITKVVV